MTDQPLLDEIPSAGAGDDNQVVEPYYGTVERFVVEYLLPNWRHPMGTSLDVCWCPEWWRHAEAISRFEALWWAWEHMRLEGGAAMSIWWRDHADHHMHALTTYGGTFTTCKKAGRPSGAVQTSRAPGSRGQAQVRSGRGTCGASGWATAKSR